MPTFQYLAQGTEGKRATGILTANSRIEAIHQLRDRSLTPVSLEVVRKQDRWRRPVPQSAIVNCFSGMADLLESGMPLLKTLEIVSNQVVHPRLSEALREVRNQVADGGSLAFAMESQPEVFDELSTSLIAVGEEGGFLEQSLQRVARLAERQAELRSHIINAIAYPTFLMFAGIIVSAGMILYFVPLFEPLFDRMRERGELPWATIALLSLSGTIREFTMPIVLLLVALSCIAKAWLSTESGLRIWDRWKITAPGIGPILRDLTIARLAHVLGTLLSNGVPMLRSLEMAEKATGNREIAKAIAEASNTVAQGESLAAPLSRCNHFPPDISETIAMGEQANRLEQVLLGLADRLERRAHKQLDLFTKLLEPLLMTVLAVMIGFLIVALLMPIFTSSGRF